MASHFAANDRRVHARGYAETTIAGGWITSGASGVISVISQP
jgi:hypothetical protein